MTDQQPAPQATPLSQQPAAQQSNDEAIGSFAREVLADIDKDSPTDRLDPNLPDEREEQKVEQATDEPETPEAEEPIPEIPEVSMVEVEIDGEKFNLPEKLKGRLMADKDYRLKTMEVSSTKKQLEQLMATATQNAQQAQQMAPYHAQLFQMENRAQVLSQALQTPQLAADPVEYNRVQGELAILLHQKDQLAGGLHQQMQRLNSEQTRLRAEALKIDAPKLFEQFPDLQKPENQQKLAKYAVDEGLPQEALDYLNYSATGTKLLWKAHQYDVMVKDQKASAAKLKEKTQNLPSASQSSRVPEKDAKQRDLQKQWQKGGGKINDPAFDELLRSKLRR